MEADNRNEGEVRKAPAKLDCRINAVAAIGSLLRWTTIATASDRCCGGGRGDNERLVQCCVTHNAIMKIATTTNVMTASSKDFYAVW